MGFNSPSPPPIFIESNTMKKELNSIPPPPPRPPLRTFRTTLFGPEIETKESKQALVNYKNYMRGWNDALKARGLIQ